MAAFGGFNPCDIEDEDDYSDGDAERASDLASKHSSPIRHEHTYEPSPQRLLPTRKKPSEDFPHVKEAYEPLFPSISKKIYNVEKKNEDDILKIEGHHQSKHTGDNDRSARKQFFQQKDRKSFFSQADLKNIEDDEHNDDSMGSNEEHSNMLIDDQQHYDLDGYYNDSPLERRNAPQEPRSVSKPRRQRHKQSSEVRVPAQASKFELPFQVDPPQLPRPAQASTKKPEYNPKDSQLYRNIIGEVLKFKQVEDRQAAESFHYSDDSGQGWEDSLQLPTDVTNLKHLIVRSVQKQVSKQEMKIKREHYVPSQVKRSIKVQRKQQVTFESQVREIPALAVKKVEQPIELERQLDQVDKVLGKRIHHDVLQYWVLQRSQKNRLLRPSWVDVRMLENYDKLISRLENHLYRRQARMILQQLFEKYQKPETRPFVIRIIDGTIKAKKPTPTRPENPRKKEFLQKQPMLELLDCDTIQFIKPSAEVIATMLRKQEKKSESRAKAVPKSGSNKTSSKPEAIYKTSAKTRPDASKNPEVNPRPNQRTKPKSKPETNPNPQIKLETSTNLKAKPFTTSKQIPERQPATPVKTVDEIQIIKSLKEEIFKPVIKAVRKPKRELKPPPKKPIEILEAEAIFQSMKQTFKAKIRRTTKKISIIGHDRDALYLRFQVLENNMKYKCSAQDLLVNFPSELAIYLKEHQMLLQQFLGYKQAEQEKIDVRATQVEQMEVEPLVGGQSEQNDFGQEHIIPAGTSQLYQMEVEAQFQGELKEHDEIIHAIAKQSEQLEFQAQFASEFKEKELNDDASMNQAREQGIDVAVSGQVEAGGHVEIINQGEPNDKGAQTQAEDRDEQDVVVGQVHHQQIEEQGYQIEIDNQVDQIEVEQEDQKLQ